MICIITGDIINSRNLEHPDHWMKPVKSYFSTLGATPRTWDIYRGDSFQLEVRQVENAFLVAIQIKAIIKSIKGIDVRIAIGIGNEDYSGSKVTESNGEAFINSGELLENIKKEKRELGIKSPWQDFDKEMNLYFKLALIAMNNWKQKTADIIKVTLENPGTGQQELATLLGINQSAVSQSHKRAHLSEIMELEDIFRDKVIKLVGAK